MAAVAATVAMGAPPARAQPDQPGSVYRLRLAVDVPVMAAAAAIWAVPSLFTSELVSPKCPCRTSRLPAFDQVAVGLHGRGAGTASDVAVTTLLVLPLGLDALDVRRAGGGWSTQASDLVVMGEAVLINGAINQMVKLAVRRPRPRVYDLPAGSSALGEPENYVSFYSSHTSTTFAVGLSYATTFALRHPQSRYRHLVYGAALAAGSTVGLLRVLAGAHFPSDVVMGAVAGSAIGLVVPRLHARGRAASIAVVPGFASLTLAGSFD